MIYTPKAESLKENLLRYDNYVSKNITTLCSLLYMIMYENILIDTPEREGLHKTQRALLHYVKPVSIVNIIMISIIIHR